MRCLAISLDCKEDGYRIVVHRVDVVNSNPNSMNEQSTCINLNQYNMHMKEPSGLGQFEQTLELSSGNCSDFNSY
jgi:hypothetical protein